MFKGWCWDLLLSLPFVSLPPFSLSILYPSSFLFHLSPSHFFLLPLNFFILHKLSSGSVGALKRMYSLSKDTSVFGYRNLQLSVRTSTVREQCWRECPLHFQPYLNIRLCFKVRLCSSDTLPCRSRTTLSSCRPSYPSVHSWMCYPAIWFRCLAEEVQLFRCSCGRMLIHWLINYGDVLEEYF